MNSRNLSQPMIRHPPNQINLELPVLPHHPNNSVRTHRFMSVSARHLLFFLCLSCYQVLISSVTVVTIVSNFGLVAVPHLPRKFDLNHLMQYQGLSTSWTVPKDGEGNIVKYTNPMAYYSHVLVQTAWSVALASPSFAQRSNSVSFVVCCVLEVRNMLPNQAKRVYWD